MQVGIQLGMNLNRVKLMSEIKTHPILLCGSPLCFYLRLDLQLLCFLVCCALLL